MAKFTLFFIHGMGQHGEHWSQKAWEAFETAYAGYEDLKDFPFDEHFAHEEVIYDHIFERHRERWREDAAGLNRLMGISDAAPALIARMAGIAERLGEGDYFTTHLLDVVMYRYLSVVAHPVQVAVATRIATHLNEAGSAAERKWSVVAHSLGTSVAHDTLHRMFTEGNAEIAPLPRQFAPEVGLFVANVSRLLERPELSVYQSVVRPSKRRRNGILNCYLSARHILDPFTRPKPFAPAFDWLDEATQRLVFPAYQELVISEVLQPDVHDLVHYLANPGVHIPLIRAHFRRRNVISDEAEHAAREAYREKALQGRLAALRNQLGQLNDEQQPGVEGLIASAEHLQTLARLWEAGT